MNIFDIILLLIIAVSLILAVKSCIKNRGRSCGSCDGNCASCMKKIVDD